MELNRARAFNMVLFVTRCLHTRDFIFRPHGCCCRRRSQPLEVFLLTRSPCPPRRRVSSTVFLALVCDNYVRVSDILTLCRSPCVGRIRLEQTDLLLEADNLDEFNANFAGKSWEDCVFPRVLHRVEDVLVGFLCRLVGYMQRHHDANT